MKEIILTQGKVAVVDDEDYEYLNQWKWQYVHGYAIRRMPTPPRVAILMHRLIINTPEDMETDHINHDGLDNRRANLRICSHSENLCNQNTQTRSLSGFKGVVFNKHAKKWQAQIEINQIQKYLGRFSTPEAAARAYDKAAQIYHGDFAKLNFSV